MLTLEQIGIIVTIVVGILDGTYYGIRIYKEMRKPPPDFILQKLRAYRWLKTLSKTIKRSRRM